MQTMPRLDKATHGDEQKSVEFLADRFKVTVSDDAAGKASIQELVSQAVNDAIANALRPGGLLFRAARQA